MDDSDLQGRPCHSKPSAVTVTTCSTPCHSRSSRVPVMGRSRSARMPRFLLLPPSSSSPSRSSRRIVSGFSPLQVSSLRIVAAAADHFERDGDGWRDLRTQGSKDATGALRHVKGSEVQFGKGWRLGGIRFRVFFRSDGKRPAQGTVTLKPPGTLAYRRTRFEKAVHTPIARHGPEKNRDAGMVADSAA
jgi:hypothetical protein